MITEIKSKIDLKKVLITLLLVLLSSIASAGGLYYVLESNFQKERSINEKAFDEIKDQMGNIEKKFPKNDTEENIASSASQITLSDKENLTILTLRKNNNSNYYSAVNINKIEGSWALTTPIPVAFSSENGYFVPGMGGVSYLWNKANDQWKFVGMATEGGWDEEVKSRFSDIPKEIIPQEQR